MSTTPNPPATPTGDQTDAPPAPAVDAPAEQTGQGQAPQPQQVPEEGESDSTEQGFDAHKALEKIRKLNSENRALRQRAQQAEQQASTVEEASERIAALEAENLRIRVGAKHGLPDVLLDRLRGSTEEEILADAQALLEVVAPKRVPSGVSLDALRGGTDPTGEPEERDLSKLGARMFSR